MLDRELRLIAPTEPDSSTPAPRGLGPTPPEVAGEMSYQLAHDYLVRPIRQWLEREQGSTHKGRAQLRLALITASWLERPGPRQLPSLLEWAGILRHIAPSEWSADERRLMAATARHYLTRAAAAVALVAGVSFAVKQVRDGARAAVVFERALASDPRDLPGLFPEIAAHASRLRADLERVERDRTARDGERAVAALLLHREHPTAGRAELRRRPSTRCRPGRGCA